MVLQTGAVWFSCGTVWLHYWCNLVQLWHCFGCITGAAWFNCGTVLVALLVQLGSIVALFWLRYWCSLVQLWHCFGCVTGAAWFNCGTVLVALLVQLGSVLALFYCVRMMCRNQADPCQYGYRSHVNGLLLVCIVEQCQDLLRCCV